MLMTYLADSREVAPLSLAAGPVPGDAVGAGGRVEAGARVVEHAVAVHSVVRPGLK